MAAAKRGRKRDPRVDAIVARYVASGQSLHAVAKAHGMSHTALYRAAQTRGVDTSMAALAARRAAALSASAAL